MEDAGKCYVHLVYLKAIWYTYFMAIWCIQWLLVYFSPFGYFEAKKSGNPGFNLQPRWPSFFHFFQCPTYPSRLFEKKNIHLRGRTLMFYKL
jgi:hypothetical protein